MLQAKGAVLRQAMQAAEGHIKRRGAYKQDLDELLEGNLGEWGADVAAGGEGAGEGQGGGGGGGGDNEAGERGEVGPLALAVVPNQGLSLEPVPVRTQLQQRLAEVLATATIKDLELALRPQRPVRCLLLNLIWFDCVFGFFVCSFGSVLVCLFVCLFVCLSDSLIVATSRRPTGGRHGPVAYTSLRCCPLLLNAHGLRLAKQC